MWLCVLGLGFQLRPATPCWGVGVCVCIGVRSACIPLLLAGVCGVGVCAWTRVSAAPRHSWVGFWGSVCAWVRAPLVPRQSWLGCAVWACVPGLGLWPGPACPGLGVGACVFVCALRLYPATPGWGMRACARVSAAPRHSWLGCWGVRVCVCAPLVPRHSWLGCAVWVGALRLGFRLRPATPGWGVGECVCLCALSSCTLLLQAGLCAVGVCAWARGLAAPCHSWLGCWGSVCACVRAPLVPRHSWLGCVVWACVLGLGLWLGRTSPGLGVGVCVFECALRLYPATAGGCVCLISGFGCAPPLLAGLLGCACLCVCSACTPPLLAGVCGVLVCVRARFLATPRPSRLGCSGVCVLVCAPRLYPATAGWDVRCECVCLGSGFGCAPLLLAGVLGCVCLCACSPLVPRHSWLRCAAWVCVLGLGSQLFPATPGWGVGVCVFVCALRMYPTTPGWGVRCGRVRLGSGFGCAPPLLAGVCGVGVCACARVSAAPRLSWLGCWGVCVLVFALRLYPATPGWGVRCGCGCLGSGFSCAPPLMAGVLGFCVCLCACFRLYPATPGWGVRCGRVRLGSAFGCAPPLLAGVCGVGVCAWARV